MTFSENASACLIQYYSRTQLQAICGHNYGRYRGQRMDWNGFVETCYINLWKYDIINGANEEKPERMEIKLLLILKRLIYYENRIQTSEYRRRGAIGKYL